ncbi:MAG: AbrB/MazE/SpoVT family DNA-binding domain-containing protein [Candidatus Helarchaeota archaeon]
MNIGTIGKKGQIVIPKEIRNKFNIKPGDVIIFKIQDERIVLEKIQEKLREILESSKPLEPSITFQKKLRNEWQ